MFLNKGKNLIINGALDYWQRGTEFLSAASGQYCADRFRYEKIGTAVHSIYMSVDTPTFAQVGVVLPWSLRLTLTTAQATLTTNQRYRISQRIEGNFFSPWKGRKLTMSFWVKASLAGTYSFTMNDSNSSASYVKDYSINAANTWEKKVITFVHSDSSGTWNYSTGVGLCVHWCLASGTDERTSNQGSWLNGDFKSSSSQINGVQSGATDFYLAGVQLEEGEQATGFERAGVNYFNELQLCQRYYEKSYELSTAPATATSVNESWIWAATATSSGGYTAFKSSKRVQPSMLFWNRLGTVGAWYDVAGAQTRSVDASYPSTNGVFIFVTPSSSQRTQWGHWAADAEL